MPILYRYAHVNLTRLGSIICKLSLVLLLLPPGKAYAQWVRKADELYQTAEGNNVVYRNKLYVFGGFSKNPVIEKRNQVYDVATDTWTDIAPFPAGKEITHNGIILVDDNVWLIGGRSVDSHGPVSSQVIIYNISTNKWINGPEIIDPATGKSFPLGGGGYILLGRTIHVFGGFGPTICVDQATLHLTINVDNYKADPARVTWQNKLAPMPIARNHISYITLGGKIYALGGQFLHDCGAKDQVYCHVYDPEKDTWTRLNDLPVVRSHAEASSFALDGKILLIAGQGAQDIPKNTVYEFNPAANNGLGSWTNKTSYKLPGNYLGLSSKILGTKIIITNGALDNYANSRKETYSYTVTRTAARTLGFGTATLAQTLKAGNNMVIKNLLYVIEDSTRYQLTSSQSWLGISKSGSGMATLNGQEIEVTINAANLSPGKYTGQIKATAVNLAATATFTVNLTVTAKLNYLVTIAKNGSGTVTQTPNQPNYLPGTNITFTAQANTGWKFDKWTGDVTDTKNPLSVVINSDKNITANFVQNDDNPNNGLITGIDPAGDKNYLAGILSAGKKYYTDRDYLLTTIPPAYIDLPLILTANDDKKDNSASLLSFTLTKAATVYVAYDWRATTIPAWLQTWQKLNDKISTDDVKLSYFSVYSKSYSAGNVSLGGNMASPAAGALCQYIVFAKAQVSTVNNSLTAASLKTTLPAYTDTTSQVFFNHINQTKLVLYPNPTRSNFKIILPESFTGLADMKIVDIYGKILNIPGHLLNLTDATLAVNASSLLLKPGLYSLRITSKTGKNYFAKVIVQ